MVTLDPDDQIKGIETTDRRLFEESRISFVDRFRDATDEEQVEIISREQDPDSQRIYTIVKHARVDLTHFLFEICGSDVAIAASIQLLKEKASSRCIVLDLLKHYFQDTKECWLLTMKHLDQYNYRVIMDDLVNTIVQLPSLLSTFQAKDRDVEWSNADSFYPRISATAIQWASTSDQYVQYFTKSLLSRLSHRQGAQYVAKGIKECYEEDKRTLEALSGISLHSRDAAIICRALVLLYMKTDSEFLRLTFDKLLRTQSAYEHFVQIAVLATTGIPLNADDDEIFCTTIVQLLPKIEVEASDSESEDEEEADMFTNQVNRVAVYWSQQSFARNAPPASQRHVSIFLVKALASLKVIDSSSDVARSIFGGVKHYLHLNETESRKNGMRVAEALAIALGESLHFSELHEAEKDSDRKKDKPFVTNASETVPVTVDDDDSVWDEDNSELPKYNLDDDESDLALRPRSLKQCLELIQTPDGEDSAFDKHQAALQALPTLVASRPLDLPDYAFSLVRKLLYLGNVFNMEDFDQLKLSALESVVRQEPRVSGDCLIESIFSDDSSFQLQLIALSILSVSAFELSEEQLLGAKQGDSETRKLLRERVESSLSSNSRLKNSRILRSQKEKVSRRERRFDAIGPVWFYELLKRFVSSKDDERLWSGEYGSQLLGHLLNTLAIIVDTSAAGSARKLMSKDLFQLAWNFRASEIVEVRRSVLLSVQASLERVGIEDILSLLQTQNNMAEDLAMIAGQDADATCQTLAKQTYEHILRKLETTGIRQLE